MIVMNVCFKGWIKRDCFHSHVCYGSGWGCVNGFISSIRHFVFQAKGCLDMWWDQIHSLGSYPLAVLHSGDMKLTSNTQAFSRVSTNVKWPITDHCNDLVKFHPKNARTIPGLTVYSTHTRSTWERTWNVNVILLHTWK